MDSRFVADYEGVLDSETLGAVADGIVDPALKADFRKQMTIVAAKLDDTLLERVAGRTGRSFSDIMYELDRAPDHDEALRMNRDFDAATLNALLANLPTSRDTVSDEDSVVRFLMSFENPAVYRDPADALRDLRLSLDIIVHADLIEFLRVGISMQRRNESQLDMPGIEIEGRSFVTLDALLADSEVASRLPSASEWRDLANACPGSDEASRLRNLKSILEISPSQTVFRDENTGKFVLDPAAPYRGATVWTMPMDSQREAEILADIDSASPESRSRILALPVRLKAA